MLAAGAMLTPGKRIPAGQLWAGRPARYVRDLTPEELAGHCMGVAHYVELGQCRNRGRAHCFEPRDLLLRRDPAFAPGAAGRRHRPLRRRQRCAERRFAFANLAEQLGHPRDELRIGRRLRWSRALRLGGKFALDRAHCERGEAPGRRAACEQRQSGGNRGKPAR